MIVITMEYASIKTESVNVSLDFQDKIVKYILIYNNNSIRRFLKAMFRMDHVLIIVAIMEFAISFKRYVYAIKSIQDKIVQFNKYKYMTLTKRIWILLMFNREQIK